MTKRVTRWTIWRHKLITWIVVTFLCALGFLFGDGFGAIGVGVLLWLYLSKRGTELFDLEWQGYVGDVGRVHDDYDNLMEDVARLRLSEFPPPDFLCRTCQCGLFSDVLPEVCPNLQDVFPHNPKADPPNPNPFRWHWFTVNGYRMPPDDHPDTEPWLPVTAFAADPVQAMSAEGREYYRTHPNPLWEAGFGKVPEWYLRMRRIL